MNTKKMKAVVYEYGGDITAETVIKLSRKVITLQKITDFLQISAVTAGVLIPLLVGFYIFYDKNTVWQLPIVLSMLVCSLSLIFWFIFATKTDRISDKLLTAAFLSKIEKENKILADYFRRKLL